MQAIFKFRTRLEPIEGGGESAGSVLPPVAVGSAGGHPEADGGDDGEDEAEDRGNHARHHEGHHSEEEILRLCHDLYIYM